MLRFLSAGHVPQVPKSFTLNGTRIPWDSRVKTFDQYVQVVRDFAVANGLLVPTKENIEDSICKQLPRSWCVSHGKTERVRSHIVPPRVERKGGCKSCGRRK